MTLRLTNEEQAALQERATCEGISVQEAARQAIRAYLAREDRRERVLTAGKWVADHHADALGRLGEHGVQDWNALSSVFKAGETCCVPLVARWAPLRLTDAKTGSTYTQRAWTGGVFGCSG